jgi:protein tyrosine phosphatase
LESSDSNPQGYINASYIEYPDTPTKYIAAQAPLVHTIDDWWNMICKLNVKVIVMLCKCFEADVVSFFLNDHVK